MHPELKELLALRDGDGSAEAARHAERCGQCRAEIEELRLAADALRSLPECAPPPEAWGVIRNSIDRQRRLAVGTRLGVAAALVFAIGLVAVVGRLGAPNGGDGVTASSDIRATVEQLSNASRELEMVLQEPSIRSPVLTPRRAAMIVELEDRIALVDLALAQSTEVPSELEVALWSDRVELLDALVTARGGDNGADGVTSAVNRIQGRRE